MSNLNLPELTFGNLARLLAEPAAIRRNSVELAYKTDAYWSQVNRELVILHHDNEIARLFSDGRITLSHAGWDSSTTANRLHKLTRDNKLNLGVAIRQREMVLINMDAKRTRVMAFNDLPMYRAEFNVQGELVLP